MPGHGASQTARRPMRTPSRIGEYTFEFTSVLRLAPRSGSFRAACKPQARVNLCIRAYLRDNKIVLQPYGDPDVHVWVPNSSEKADQGWITREIRRAISREKCGESSPLRSERKALQDFILDKVANHTCADMTGDEYDECREASFIIAEEVWSNKRVLNFVHVPESRLMNDKE